MKETSFHDDDDTTPRAFWRYPREHIDRILDLADTVGIIGQYVNLKQTGHGRWMGVCPFHNDHDPSFSVNERGFYCFGCQIKGSVIKFLMAHEGLSFVETIKLLEQLTGVTPPTPQDRVLGCWTITTPTYEVDTESIEELMWQISNRCRETLSRGWEIPIVYERMMTIFRMADDALEEGNVDVLNDIIDRTKNGMVNWERITNEQGREGGRTDRPA